MTLLDKIFCTLFTLGLLLAYPAIFIGPMAIITCLAIGVIGAIGMIMSVIWGEW